MKRYTLPMIYPFLLEDVNEKTQALKVLEEASELVESIKSNPDNAIYELMDTIQALTNLAYLKGWTEDDLYAAYKNVYISNVNRGRYSKGNETK